MKNLTVEAGTPSYAGVSGSDTFPIVVFGAALLDAAYDVINDLLFSGGGGAAPTITLTKQNVDTIDSFNTQNNMLGNQNGVFNQISNVARNLNTSTSSFAPVIQPPTGVLDSFAQGDGTASFNAPDLDKIQSLGTPTTAVTSVTATPTNNVVNTSTLLVVSDNLTKDLTTNNVDVVTDATVSGGGGGSPFSDNVTYEFDGDEVVVSGTGYKRKLSETFHNPLKIKGIRVFVQGTDPNFSAFDMFSLDSYLIKSGGRDIEQNPFILADYFSPRNVQGNIVDIPLETLFDPSTALVINALKSATVTYRIGFFY